MAEEAVTTPTPEKEKATTPESGAITGEKPAGEPTPPENPEVAALKSEVDTLKKQLDQTKILQSQADKKKRIEKLERLKLEKQLKRIQAGETGETFISPEPTGETPVEKGERLTARIGIQNLIMSNSDYLKLLEQDITLKEVIRNNPFAIITDWLDSEDAVAQMKDYLDSRISSLTQPKKEEKKEEEKKFEVGPIQPPESVSPETITPQSEALKKGDIAGSIRAKIKTGE